MALTPFRWIAMAAIGCMLAVVALVSEVDSSTQLRYRNPLGSATDLVEARMRDRAGGLNQSAQNLATRYRLLFLLDSVGRATARVPDTGAIRVFIASGYPAETRALIDRGIARGIDARGGNAGRVDVFVVSDTPKTIRGIVRYLPQTEVRYQFPERAGERCRVFIRTFYVGDVSRAFETERSVQHVLGPCGYYAAFGEPGPGVRQWLVSSGGWQYAIEGSWSAASARPQLREDSSIFKGPDPALQYLNVGTGATECMKGDLATCERVAAVRVPSRWMGALVGSGTYALTLGRSRFFRGAIGYQAGGLLADAVRDMGRDRFRAFWTSPDSVPVAYEKATGERWGAFLQRWMIQQYGELHPGPRMSAYSLITSTILVILALGATMMISMRRTYT